MGTAGGRLEPAIDHLGVAWADQLATSRRTVDMTGDSYAAGEQVEAHLAAAADGYRGAYPMPATVEEDDGWHEAHIAEDAPPEDVAGAAAHYRAVYARQQQDDDGDGWF